MLQGHQGHFITGMEHALDAFSVRWGHSGARDYQQMIQSANAWPLSLHDFQQTSTLLVTAVHIVQHASVIMILLIKKTTDNHLHLRTTTILESGCPWATVSKCDLLITACIAKHSGRN